MGIPSYFSYIVKNHLDILQAYSLDTFPDGIDNLFMDCNSIIYDAVRSIDVNTISNKQIIGSVLKKIEEYIRVMAPKKRVMIAFDGVAPVAKMEQQRGRRYKSLYQERVRKSFQVKETIDSWNTTVITPGTVFMDELNKAVVEHFQHVENDLQIIVSTSHEYGEGEHKLFAYIREHKDIIECDISVVYGLDADLIMLSLHHLPIHPHIYLYRETPEFIKTIDASLEPNQAYVLHIPRLADAIISEMSTHSSDADARESESESQTPVFRKRLYDYIFLCFFLGNDFLPHFPAINIRTGGIDKLLQAYKYTLGATPNVLTDGTTIFWKQVRKFVAFLADQEETWFQQEMKKRDRQEKYNHCKPSETREEMLFQQFENIPCKERDLEKYVQPSDPGWPQRYYEALHPLDDNEDDDDDDTIVFQQDKQIKDICLHYLQGLEWNLKYYTTGCPDWRWTYPHHYPPLLRDLIRWVPFADVKELLPTQSPLPVSPLVQLCYVLPYESLTFLPTHVKQWIKLHHSAWYPRETEFVWAFCKYFWECHVDLPTIDMDLLEREIAGLS